MDLFYIIFEKNYGIKFFDYIYIFVLCFISLILKCIKFCVYFYFVESGLFGKNII